MQIGPYVEALQADVGDLAALGDEVTRDAGARLSQALEATLGLRILEVLTEAASEISAQLPAGRVDVRLPVQQPSLVYVEHEQRVATAAAVEQEPSARITLRLSEALKLAIEAAATSAGLSANAWLVRELTRAVAAPGRPIGHRLTGFAHS
jgi:hypothetical protein